jgi:ABC-type nitrate/sulfonate/bicarbonate transport system permease component
VFVALGVVAIAGVVFDQVFQAAEKKLLRWRPAVT